METAVYADDTIYYTSSKDSNKIVRELNNQLDLTHEWCTKWRIKINADKLEAIIFTRGLKGDDIDPPKYNNVPIHWKRSVKYLGLTLDRQLNFCKHITNKRNQTYVVIGKLMPILKCHFTLGIKNGLLVYKMLIRLVFLRPIIVLINYKLLKIKYLN